MKPLSKHLKRLCGLLVIVTTLIALASYFRASVLRFRDSSQIRITGTTFNYQSRAYEQIDVTLTNKSAIEELYQIVSQGCPLRATRIHSPNIVYATKINLLIESTDPRHPAQPCFVFSSSMVFLGRWIKWETDNGLHKQICEKTLGRTPSQTTYGGGK